MKNTTWTKKVAMILVGITVGICVFVLGYKVGDYRFNEQRKNDAIEYFVESNIKPAFQGDRDGEIRVNYEVKPDIFDEDIETLDYDVYCNETYIGGGIANMDHVMNHYDLNR